MVGVGLEPHAPDPCQYRFLDLRQRSIRQRDDAGDLAFAEHIGNELALEIVEIGEPEQLRRRVGFLARDRICDPREQRDRVWAAPGKLRAVERCKLGERTGRREASFRCIETLFADRKHADRLLGAFGRIPESDFHNSTPCVRCWGTMVTATAALCPRGRSISLVMRST